MGRGNWLRTLGPGILIAATGVGAGDLVTAGLAGNRLGPTIFWAVLLGALLKWGLNEGLARWQLGSGTSLLAAWKTRLRVHWIFLVYLLCWSFFTGGALISATGIAGAALFPLRDPEHDKILWGMVHSVVAVALVYAGGFRLFERVMSFFIAVMFIAVLSAGALLAPRVAWHEVAWVNPFALQRVELQWIVGLIGGVGGTVTLLSYGYWIREEGRSGQAGVRSCRIDLAVGYGMTALFGIGMVLIAAATPDLSGSGAGLLIKLADQLEAQVGVGMRWLFLIGGWGAIFSSMLGVWQGIPYLFADLVTRRQGAADEPDAAALTRSGAYRWYVLYLAFPPMVLLWYKLVHVQLAYAIIGALFLPLLAATLLVLNNSRALPEAYRSRWGSNALLAVTLAFFAWVGWLQINKQVGKLRERGQDVVHHAEHAGQAAVRAGGDVRGHDAVFAQQQRMPDG